VSGAAPAAVVASSTHARERRVTLLETALLLAAIHAYAWFGQPSAAADCAALGATGAVMLAILARRGEDARSLGALGEVRGALLLVGPAAAATAAIAIALRLALGPARPVPLYPDLLEDLATYPLWGLAQQLLYIGVVYRGLVRAGADPRAAGAASSVLFALIHAPNWPLVAATLPLGLACAAIYRRAPSLVALGLLHGVGGTLAEVVLGMDLEVGAGFLRPH
jgi:membrane protease YdiL (CAAX protease family)